ncbi:pyridoxamine 5'-phosphate oxidase family protein [Microbacterium oleivorans]|uniref:pyridoxamine 5'-phosphate oxidase family protein n=1 Tax=Microbacterium oleivorans TaxID=273677 RepID=UPI0010A4A81F|nr:pyridoxamine 5'-phosphate oxidase family protein [Microbacterium oleivorans]THE07508.1 pyridoxamine 5'-phosphate oxidase family protein [Microbacterium oleivorans]
MDRSREDPGKSTRPGSAALVEDLDLSEAWRLIESGYRGRLSVIGGDDAPDIFPLDYVTRSRQIYCRTAPGMKALLLARNPRVAFEVDGDGTAGAWSVVIRGVAWRVDDADDAAQSGVTDFRSSAPPPRDVLLRIAPFSVLGRRLRARLE